MNIEARLEQLEKQMQFYKRMVIVLALVIVAGVTMGQTSGYGDVRCRSLQIVNDEGKTVVNLVNSVHGGNLHLYDFEGNEKMWIFASPSGSGLYGFSKEGNIVLSARVEGGTQMGNFKSFSDKDKYNPIWTALTNAEMYRIKLTR